MITKPRAILFIFGLLTVALSNPLSADGDFRVSSGIDFSSGDYGSGEDTDIIYVPVNISYLTGPWQAKLTVPWVQIKGPGNVIGGGDGGVIIGDGSSDTTTESGLGDIWLSLVYSVEAVPEELFFMDVSGKVKLPTADENKGLGTGEVDYTLQLDFFKPLGAFTPMATVAYKIKTDPDEYDLDNVFYLSLGLDYRYDEVVNFGVSFDFQEASTNTSDDALEVFSYLGYKLDEDWLLTIYGYAGLSDGSPDAGGGLQIRYSL